MFEEAGPGGWRDLKRAALDDGVPHTRIGELCMELADVAGAGISLMTSEGNSGMVYASDETSARIEELQFLLSDGPCRTAFRSGEPVFIADLEDPVEGAAQLWPVFVEEAAELGVRAVYAIPLCIGAIRLGVLDLYRRAPGALTAEQLRYALLVADLAALSLLHLAPGVDTPLEVACLDGSLYHVEMHQATGMITVQTGLAIEDALLLLRAYAFTETRAVDDVARDVIAGRLVFPMEDS